LALCAATALTVHAQTFTTLFTFDTRDGLTLDAGLVQGISGTLYGTNVSGGANGYGTFFEITPAGALTTLHGFDGGSPSSGAVLQAANGDFYGTGFGGRGTCSGGCGTVFKITPSGALTTLYSFDLTDGADPNALIQAANADFYGTTIGGGANTNARCPEGCGTVFKIAPAGTLTTLYSFCSQSDCTDGLYPETGLVQAANGDLYGTTGFGGIGTCANGCGTIFKITPTGTLTTLYSFDRTDGGNPYAGLVQAANGDFYGTTLDGGANNSGTVFEITADGVLTTLYSFCAQIGCPDGASPYAGLIQATDGNLYGTTVSGGSNQGGTIFKVTPAGKLHTLYSFCHLGDSTCTDGASPYAGLVQATNGDFYGTTEYGGADTSQTAVCWTSGAKGCGTVFRLSVGLGPFVKTLPTSGAVGAAVQILGSDLAGTTSVTFNGAAASFTVNPTGAAIATNVPVGATSGTIQVVTPSGTLSSNLRFRVP
jgi:uncharacterized repeat protein (TIGR03803 family)